MPFAAVFVGMIVAGLILWSLRRRWAWLMPISMVLWFLGIFIPLAFVGILLVTFSSFD
jgi:hypothetical protein